MFKNIKNDKYTGENRCLPCTVVNLILAVAIAVSSAAVLWSFVGGAVAGAAGTAILVLSACIIWFRGYLVPRTPKLTKRYMPDRALAWFGKANESTHATSLDDESEVERFLLETGVLEPCSNQDDLCLADDFADQWDVELTKTGDVDTETISSILGIDVSDELTNHDDNAVSLAVDSGLLIQWPSQAALQVDVAAARTLKKLRHRQWRILNGKTRGHILAGLRIFARNCPNGDTTTVQNHTVESCCSTHDVSSIICSESGARIVEQRVP